jgi:CRISPR system Cascade subunit CasD
MSTPGQRRWLVMRLEAPLLSFGGVAIDHFGVTRDFPALSMLTGLFANALGLERTQRQEHQDLQDRLIFAARRDSEPHIDVLRDIQNARLYANEEGWTTRGAPEGRNKQSKSFNSVDLRLSDEDQKKFGDYQTHQRQRDYHPDALVAVVLTLVEAPTGPTLDDLANALDQPARPLFIGRKPCLPSAPLRHRLPDGSSFLEAATAHAALSLLPCLRRTGTSRRDLRSRRSGDGLRALWPADEGPTSGPAVDRAVALADRRNWISGLHGGTRSVIEGRIAPPEAAV